MPPQYPSIGGYLYRNKAEITFQEAIEEFRTYCFMNNQGNVPVRMGTKQGEISKDITGRFPDSTGRYPDSTGRINPTGITGRIPSKEETNQPPINVRPNVFSQ